MYTGRLIESLNHMVENAERKAKVELGLLGQLETWVTTPVFAWEEFTREQSRRGEA